ncbi:MOSC domain-containing protein [Streptomyces coelicoflavus]
MAYVVDLIRYPVKGCAGTSLNDALLTPAGLAHDRSFMVISEDGIFRTQRRHPRLALIRPAISTDGTRLTLDAACGADGTGRFGTLCLDVTTSAPRRDVDLFGTAFQGIDQGDEVTAWLSEFLGTPSRLVRVPPEHDRISDGLTPGPSGYADSSAVHLLTRASLVLLNQRMAERGAPILPMNRFRPNVVVDSHKGYDNDRGSGSGGDRAALPHAEDRARRISIGGAELGYAKLAVRCAVTLVEQEAGARRGPEPLRTLASYRRAASGGVVFGAKFSVITPGKLSVGDEVVVQEWGDAEPQPLPTN